jgi:hypothetical protein
MGDMADFLSGFVWVFWSCDTAGLEACATMVCHGFAGFTMKYPG